LIGYTSDSLETTYTKAYNITQGTMYRFRYRCRNVNGWSSYSPITYIAAATIPVRPPAPVFSTATATSITLNLFPSTDSRGSSITSYELWKNAGGTSTLYSITSYDGYSSTATITTSAPDSLVAGSIYKFKYRALNDYGASDFSDEVNAGVTSFPTTPTAPT
jgi:hypothetical protein